MRAEEREGDREEREREREREGKLLIIFDIFISPPI